MTKAEAFKVLLIELEKEHNFNFISALATLADPNHRHTIERRPNGNRYITFSDGSQYTYHTYPPSL